MENFSYNFFYAAALGIPFPAISDVLIGKLVVGECPLVDRCSIHIRSTGVSLSTYQSKNRISRKCYKHNIKHLNREHNTPVGKTLSIKSSLGCRERRVQNDKYNIQQRTLQEVFSKSEVLIVANARVIF